MALETDMLSMTGLVEVVSNIIGLWPLIVLHLKETGSKNIAGSLAVNHSLLCFVSCNYDPQFSFVQ